MIQQVHLLRNGTRTVVGTALAVAIAGLVACGAPAQPTGLAPSFDPGSPRASATGIGNRPSSRPSSPDPGPVTTQADPGFVVEGIVLSSPSCPGPAVAGSPCPDRPVAGA
jgi:hypothetical protein